MRISIIIPIALLMGSVQFSAAAPITREQAADNISLLAGSMKEYIAPKEKLTPAPKGYKPFYLSHYGRHGSRYLHESSYYTGPMETLEKAHKDGALTVLGEDVYNKISIIYADAITRVGDLTPKGQAQHRGIADRMVDNYPEIFNGKAYIVARSTTSHRVMMSMMSAVTEFQKRIPGMQISIDASAHDNPYMSTITEPANTVRNNSKKGAAVNAFNAKHSDPERLMLELFKDTAYIRHFERTIQPRTFSFPGFAAAQTQSEPRTVVQDMSGSLFNQLMDIAQNMQSHNYGFDFNNLFTPDEWYDAFLKNNLYWYSVSAFTPLTDNIVPFGQENLLENIISCADSAIENGGINANLRYGHDTYLFPLVCLMEINDCAWSVEDFEHVADRWVDYDIVYMGSNLQLVFYRNRKGHVIVKALLNETESKLPIETDIYPYYDWNRLKAYYRDRLEEYGRNK